MAPQTVIEAQRGRRLSRFWRVSVRSCFLFMVASLILPGAACLNKGPYVVFRQLDFRYEHPRGWARNVEKYPTFFHTIVWDPKSSDSESPVKIFVDVRLERGAKADQEAEEIVSAKISSLKGEHNFTLTRQESVILSGSRGYLAEYDYDSLSSQKAPPEKRFYIPTRVIDICVGRNGSVYEVWISASQNEWSAHEKDIQHILDTFKWK
jgi:hypothetical protein